MSTLKLAVDLVDTVLGEPETSAEEQASILFDRHPDATHSREDIREAIVDLVGDDGDCRSNDEINPVKI